jgi:hypothetical protein
MVVPLDSPRWNDLRHAYGPAGDVPDLIRAVEAEATPDYSDGGAWCEVYSSLFHQHSTYSATYAALPHLVRVAGSRTLPQRVAVLCLVGEIMVYGHPEEEIPADLLPDFERAVAEVKRSSLFAVREAALAGEVGWTLGDLLLAFGGLRHPESGYVVQLGYLVREDWSVEAGCPRCGETMVAELGEEEIVTLRLDGRGGTLPESATASPVDRSGYADRVAKGRAVLALGSHDWPLEDTPAVLAALAGECGDGLLADRILDLGILVSCAYCGQGFILAEGLRAL